MFFTLLIFSTLFSLHLCELVINETPLASAWMRPAGPSVFDRVIVYQSLTPVNTLIDN